MAGIIYLLTNPAMPGLAKKLQKQQETTLQIVWAIFIQQASLSSSISSKPSTVSLNVNPPAFKMAIPVFAKAIRKN